MTPFNILGDGILLSTSLVACFYCILLSRRVRRLASADQGVGKGIADMTQAVERLNASLEQTRLAARNESETLQRQLTEGRSLADQTGDLLEEGEHRLEDLSKGLAEARQMVKALESLAETANKRRARTRRASLRDEWSPDLADGLPSDEPAIGPDRVPPPSAKRRARPADDEALLLNAIVLDQSEEEYNDPFADVMPITRRHSRHTSRGQRGEA